jgi:hypothetical protein
MSALKSAPFLFISYRNLRLELARCQKKIAIRVDLKDDASNDDYADGMKKIKRILSSLINEDQIKISLNNQDGSIFINAILRFDCLSLANNVFSFLHKEYPEWQVEWLLNDRSSMGSNIRSSGLVQIVPSKLHNFLDIFTLSSFPSWTIPDPSIHCFNNSGIGIATTFPPSPYFWNLNDRRSWVNPTPPFEEELYSINSTSLCNDFEEIALNEAMPHENGSLKHLNIPEKVLEATLFVGRLNSRKISRDLLYEHFKSFGSIRYICLFNRNAISPEGSKNIE